MSNSAKLPFKFSVNVDTQDNDSGKPPQQQQESCFNIAVIGNFSGDQPAGRKPDLGERRFIEIDRYNYNDVVGDFSPRLSIEIDQMPLDITLATLKDFHPDSLFKKVDWFAQMRDLRSRLNNPATFKLAMEEIELEDENPPSRPPEPAEPDQPPLQASAVVASQAAEGSLIDSILNETEGRSGNDEMEATSGAKSLVDAFIKQTVKSSTAVSRDARQDEIIASIDATIAQHMQHLLHHPDFQALESLWRAVYFLVKRIRSGKSVKLYLLDVDRAELASELAADDVTQSALYRMFCDTSLGDIDWNLIVGDFRFGADIDDMLLLSQLGIISQQAGAHIIAAADGTLVGCESFAKTPKADDWNLEMNAAVSDAWTLLRQSPVANVISLALPGFILREPYGKKSTPIKSFAFEEMSAIPAHEDFLWGNAAFLKAEQFARAFLLSGWEMQYAQVMSCEDLPVYHYQEKGQARVKPCAEIPLTDTGASRMIAQGLIPLWSVKNADRIHSGDFHSISQ